MSPEVTGQRSENPESPLAKPPAIKAAAPEVPRENPDTMHLRRLYTAFDQKMQSAIEFAKNTPPHNVDTAIKDFCSDFPPADLQLLKDKQAQFIFKNVERTGGDLKHPTYSAQINIVTITATGIKIEIRSLDRVMNIYSAETMAIQSTMLSSDQSKAPNAGPEKIDRPAHKLFSELQKKANDALAQFSTTPAGDRKNSNLFRSMLNDYISDAYARLTITEKASLMSMMNQKISIETKLPTRNFFFGTDTWKLTLNFCTNNYFITQESK